jgi:anti-sigma factor RsiW
MPSSQSDRCGWVCDRVEAWIDGELEPASAARMDAHVAGCGRCAAEVAAARSVAAELRALSELAPPAAVVDEVRTRTRPRVRARRAWWAVGAAAAVVMAVGVGSAVHRHAEEARIARASVEARYALAVVARAGLAGGREAAEGIAAGALRSVTDRATVRALAGAPRNDG